MWKRMKKSRNVIFKGAEKENRRERERERERGGGRSGQ